MECTWILNGFINDVYDTTFSLSSSTQNRHIVYTTYIIHPEFNDKMDIIRRKSACTKNTEIKAVEDPVLTDSKWLSLIFYS